MLSEEGFRPEVKLVDLGTISETVNPFTGKIDYVEAACIVSDVGVNRERVADLVKIAVRKVAEKDGRRYTIFTKGLPMLEVLMSEKSYSAYLEEMLTE